MVNFFTSVREAGRGKEEVVLPSRVLQEPQGKELSHQHGKSVPLYIFPRMNLPVGTPWGITGNKSRPKTEEARTGVVSFHIQRQMKNLRRSPDIMRHTLVSSCWPAFPGRRRGHRQQPRTQGADTYLPRLGCSQRLMGCLGMKKPVSWD